MKCFKKLPGHGLPGRGLPGRGLPGRGLPGRGLPGHDLPGRGLSYLDILNDYLLIKKPFQYYFSEF